MNPNHELAAADAKAGLSNKAIAVKYGWSVGYVRNLLHEMGVRRPARPGGNSRLPRALRPREDIAARLAVLLGQRPRPPSPRRAIPDSDLFRYAGTAGTASAIGYAVEKGRHTPGPSGVSPHQAGTRFDQERLNAETDAGGHPLGGRLRRVLRVRQQR